MKFFKVIVSQKEIFHLKKIVRKFIPKRKLGRKWLMHDANKGMGVFPRLYEENWTLNVMEDMESSNEGSLTIVG